MHDESHPVFLLTDFPNTKYHTNKYQCQIHSLAFKDSSHGIPLHQIEKKQAHCHALP